MLRPRPVAPIGRGDDLLVRMHVLPKLRGRRAQGPLPELRRRAGGAPAPAGRQARQIPGFDGARSQTGGLPFLTIITTLTPNHDSRSATRQPEGFERRLEAWHGAAAAARGQEG